MTPLNTAARTALEHLPDAYRLTPECFSPNDLLVALAAEGLAKWKRERPAPGAPFRYFVKRTSLGRMALGLPAKPEGEPA